MYQPMDAGEFRDLIERAQRGEVAARNTLIERNIQLVKKVADSCTKNGVSYYCAYEDIFQEGVFGLIRAIGGFEVGRTKFSTYASICIKLAIKDAYRDKGFMIRVPNHMRYLIRHGKRLDVIKKVRKGVITDQDILSARRALEGHVSIEAHRFQFSRWIASERHCECADDIVNNLDGDERAVIVGRYGIGKERGESIASLSRRLGISESHIYTIHNRAIRKLRAIYAQVR